MKKCVIVALLLVWVCFLLAGCTPPESDSGSPDVSLPIAAVPSQTLPRQTEQNIDHSTENSKETLNSIAETEDTVSQTEPTELPTQSVELETEDPEEESMSEIVVDGGNGFGIGGN